MAGLGLGIAGVTLGAVGTVTAVSALSVTLVDRNRIDHIESIINGDSFIGPSGEQGPSGEDGPPGEKGDKGDKGDTGDTGATGEQGDPGDEGPSGAQGPSGEQGETGEQGPSGQIGPSGQMGPSGVPGTGIVESVTGTLEQITVTGTAQDPVVGLASEVITILDSWNNIRPSGSPQNLQLLQYQTAVSKLVWVFIGALPWPLSRDVYVDKSGNDTTGNGTIISPYLTIKKALQVTMSGTSATAQTTINIGSGIFVEDNSTPFTITSSGFTLKGQSSRATIVLPSDPTQNMYVLPGVNFIAMNIRFEPNVDTSTATAFVMTGNFASYFTNCLFRFWNLPFSISGNGINLSSVLFDTCLFGANATCMTVTATNTLFNDSQVRGTFGATPSNSFNGILCTDPTTAIYVSGSLFVWLGYGIRIANGCTAFINSCNFIFSNICIQLDTTGSARLTACSFSRLDEIASVKQIGLKVIDAGSNAQIGSSTFDGRDFSGNIDGIAVVVQSDGEVGFEGCAIVDCAVGVQIGVSSGPPDGQGTSAIFASSSFTGNTESVHLRGTCTMVASLITIDDPMTLILEDVTNVRVSLCNITSANAFLEIGNYTNTDFGIISIATKTTNPPVLKYLSDVYGAESFAFTNPDTSANASITAIAEQDASVNSITRLTNQESSLIVYSDTASTPGDGTSVRGWRVYKQGGSNPSGQLNFAYKNNIVGQNIVSETTIMQLDATTLADQKLRLLSLELLWGSSDDTSLFRVSAGTLETPGNFVIGGLTTSRVVVSDGTKQLASSAVTSTELGYVSGVTSAIQTQINGKLSLTGGTLTGSAVFPAGTVSTPAIDINGDAGFYAEANNEFDLETGGVHRMKIDGSGVVFLYNYTTQGVVHCAGTTSNPDGQLTSSQVVNADIQDGTIATVKLATVSSSNTNNYIVQRDSSGNFSATMISLSGTPTNATDATTKSYVDSVAALGITFHEAVVVVAVANVTGSPPTGDQTIDSVLVTTGQRVLLTAQTSPINNGAWVVGAPWTRATDFNTGDTAGAAYFLVLQGTIYAGSAWICSTPTAVIDTDPITFTIFSSPVVIAGSNVGTGSGSVFKNTVGTTLNFRKLLNDGFMVISTDTNDVKLAVDATSTNTASKVVARDGSGNFSAGTITASLTGAASLNLLLTGGTLSGNVLFPAGSVGQPIIRIGTVTVGLSSATTEHLEFQTNGAIVGFFDENGVLNLPLYVTTGILHIASGVVTSSQIVNADVSNSAAIVDTKLATISTAGKVSNSATTATAANTNNAIVARDASGNFAAGVITSDLVGSVTGAASLNVLKSGDVMTGTLTVPLGSAASPSLLFDSSSTGLSAASGALQFSTANTLRLSIDSGGVVTIVGLTLGVLHSSSGGLLTSSDIVNADISNSAAISDTKLATISTAGKVANTATTATAANTASAIVLRDSSGDFAAGIITATLVGNVTGSASLNLLLTGGTLTGALTIPLGSAASPSLVFVGGTAGFSSASGNIQFSTANTLRLSVDSSGVVTIADLSSTGVVHNSSGGVLSTSLIVNADVSNSAAIVDTKLATISTAGKVSNSATTATAANTASAIVLRDSSGDFAAGIITAALVGNVTGSASLNLLLTGGTLTGALTIPLGSAASPSLVFVGGTAGFSSASGNIQFSTANTLRLSVDSSGVVTIVNLSSTGIVHNSSGGVLTTSLIVNADVDPAAGIVDTKLATISTSGKVSNSATTATAANTASAIVARDGSGNFTAGTITAALVGNVTGSASLNLLLTGGTLSGSLTVPIGTAISPSLLFSGGTAGFSSLSGSVQISTANALRLSVDSSGVVTIANLASTGIVHASSAGVLSSSLIVDADISGSAAIADTKLATISTAGKVANSATTGTTAATGSTLMLRDSSGNCTVAILTMDSIVPASVTQRILIGTNVSISSGNNGIAIGASASGAGAAIVAIGAAATANGGSAIAIGNTAFATALNAICIAISGTNSTANSFLFGSTSVVNIRPNNTNTCDLGTTAAQFLNVWTNNVDRNAATLNIGPTSATAVSIGNSGITTTVNGTFVQASFSRASWYCQTTYNPTFVAATNRLIPPTTTIVTGTLSNFTHSAGVLTYTGTRTRTFQVIFSITFLSGPAGSNMIFFISKNASTTISTSQTQKRLTVDAGNNATVMCLDVIDFVDLATNDTIQPGGTSALGTSSIGLQFVDCKVAAYDN